MDVADGAEPLGDKFHQPFANIVWAGKKLRSREDLDAGEHDCNKAQIDGSTPGGDPGQALQL